MGTSELQAVTTARRAGFVSDLNKSYRFARARVHWRIGARRRGGFAECTADAPNARQIRRMSGGLEPRTRE
jgi:hypothetical protein